MNRGLGSSPMAPTMAYGSMKLPHGASHRRCLTERRNCRRVT